MKGSELLIDCTTVHGTTAIKVPANIFSSAADQLRWDAFRQDQLVPDEWSHIKAWVRSGQNDSLDIGSEPTLTMELKNEHLDLEKAYSMHELQRLELYIRQQLTTMKDEKLELTILPGQKITVPLPPTTLPIYIGPHYRDKESPLQQIIVRRQAQEQLAELSSRSLEAGIELGGSLMGYLENAYTTIIQEVKFAPSEGGSQAEFSFSPMFWSTSRSQGNNSSEHILGWVHSHLCNQGYPTGLSLKDLQVAHQFFALPWLITALVCASEQGTAIKWYGWSDGASLTLLKNPYVT